MQFCFPFRWENITLSLKLWQNLKYVHKYNFTD